ncbi:MAG: hypothetical protein QM484_07345 [Woeseiaceae bacterium]
MSVVKKKNVPELMERKNIYSRVLNDFKEIIHKYEDDTGSLGIAEDPAEYETATLQELAHSIGDIELFFSDEVKHSRQVTALAHFQIVLDQPYQQGLAGLNDYAVASELLSRGIVSDEILTEYLKLTGHFQETLCEYGLSFNKAEEVKQGTLFWSLSEAREGSTVLEFVLNAWGYSAAIGLPIFGFLMAYPKASEGLEKLLSDIKQKPTSKKSSMIITENLEEEIRKIKSERKH